MLPLNFELNEAQRAVVAAPLAEPIFLEGPAGAGKTSAALARLLAKLEAGVPGGEILIWLPQRTLGLPYLQALRQPGVAPGGVPALLTVGGLARRMVDLFWPLVAESAGFAQPDQPPAFLTLETAQYYMAHLVRPLLDEGLFASLTIDRNRLYSQILDNLNKAALVGFPHTEIGQRLQSAWVGEASQLRIYADAQTCANRFREYCLAHNLLDFSLQVEVLRDDLWPDPLCRKYLVNQYRHLIYDNPEEDAPVAHDLVREWLPDFESALLVYDWQAGYRAFLGADPQGAYRLKEACPQRLIFADSLVNQPQLQALAVHMEKALTPPGASLLFRGQTPAGADFPSIPLEAALEIGSFHFYPEMLDWVVGEIAELVHGQGVPPGEMVVLSPFLSDALRFSLLERLAAAQVPARSHRPSRSLREEPATLCLLTLAKIAHPDWELAPSKFDVTYALLEAIEGLDLVRAQLLAEIVYRVREGKPALTSFDPLQTAIQQRITYLLGERFEKLRLWLAGAAEQPQAFDHFLSRLFGEVLSQPGYGFHVHLDRGAVTANLIESVQKFRWAAGERLEAEGIPLGKEYIAMVEEGVIAAQYLRGWEIGGQEALLLAPAYTYLMSNRPVDYQFWLDLGSRGWSERLNQPLTHPYILSRAWEPGRLWGDQDEVQASMEALHRLALGLTRRCRQRLYVGLSDLGEQGYEQRGLLLRAFQRVLRAWPRET